MLNLFEVSELKKMITSETGAELHFHDTCGGQYFMVTQCTGKAVGLIWSFLKEKKQTAVFSEEECAFTIK